jgi:hypothetical protein
MDACLRRLSCQPFTESAGLVVNMKYTTLPKWADHIHEGSIIKLTDPTKSSWPDTMGAVANGRLVVGRSYVVTSGLTNSLDYGYSVTIRLDNGTGWSLGLAAFEPRRKRNLPDWW